MEDMKCMQFSKSNQQDFKEVKKNYSEFERKYLHELNFKLILIEVLVQIVPISLCNSYT